MFYAVSLAVLSHTTFVKHPNQTSLIQGSEGIVWSESHTGWSFDSPIPHCQWSGITCRIGLNGGAEQSVITVIRLPNGGLSGTIPTELGLLSGLEELTLKGNLLRGSIPREVAGLKNLHTLDLTDCLLTGTLPQIFESPNLEKLLLGENGIQGKFFHEDTSPHLQSVKEVNLEKNLLTGTLHGSTLLKMQQLETLSLSENEISGVIPGKALGSLSNLQYLYLDANNLVGPLTAQLAQEGKAQLLELWLQSNSLSGTVPSSFVRFDKLHDFFIDGNKLTGALPPDICGPNINSDFFTEVPSDAERNYCDSIACPAGSAALEGVFPCSQCIGGDVAKRKNPYLGHKGECENWSQREILIMFYASTSKNGAWTGVNDWNDESKGMCELTGIRCDGHGNVVKIDLRNRNLTGSIPDSLGFLPYLEQLDVSDNALTGYLPSDLRWTPLTTLDISGNEIVGVVPPLLCLKEELNGNGKDNIFRCNRVSCPLGTFNAIGRYEEGLNCKPCYDDHPFIGQKTCKQRHDLNGKFHWMEKDVETVRNSTQNLNTSGRVGLGIALSFLGIALLKCAIARCVKQNPRRMYEQQKMINYVDESSSEDSHDEDYGEYMDDEEDENTQSHFRESRYRNDVSNHSEDESDESEDEVLVNGIPHSPIEGSISSGRSAPVQCTDFIRGQQERSISKQGGFKKATKRAQQAIRSSVTNITNGAGRLIQNNASFGDSRMNDLQDEPFGSDLEMANSVGRGVECNSSQGEDFNHRGGSPASSGRSYRSESKVEQWKYSDLLDVPTIE